MARFNFLTQRIFRRGVAVTATTDTATAEGRGYLVACSQSGQTYGDTPHPLGELTRPLVRFYGAFVDSPPFPGGTLTAENETYRILDEQKITPLITRLTLERSEPT